jgi:hypothetical protein
MDSKDWFYVLGMPLLLVLIVLVSRDIYKSWGHQVIKYDCSIAEISPDYPIEVKEQCRKLRSRK